MIALLLLLAFSLPSRPAQAASKSKIFVMTSTYGVLTGTLAGLASLAFYGNPGEHTRNMAMGASLGLYAGIALGLYIVYATPEKEKKEVPGGTRVDPNENPLGLDGAQSSLRHEIEIPRLLPAFTVGRRGEPMVGLSYVF